jgi:hypothetical protein
MTKNQELSAVVFMQQSEKIAKKCLTFLPFYDTMVP